MKKIVALVLVLLLLVPYAGLAQSFDLSKMTDDELTALANAIVTEQQKRNQSDSGYLVAGTIDDVFVGLKSVLIKKDSDGNKVAVLVMDFSHTNDEAQSFLVAVSPKVFQDGIGCETSYYYDNENLLTEIKKGATIEVTQAYIITTKSPLEIEIAPLFSFGDEKLETTYVIE